MDFNQVVQNKISEAEALIKEIQGCRKSLEENSTSVKCEIGQSFEQKALSLHQRRVQLCRQVDVLVSHQERRYQLDLAKLHQYQGSLFSLLQLYANGKLHGNTDPTSLLGDLVLPKVKVAVQRLEFASTGELQLAGALGGFGHTNLLGGRSPSLDVEEEDYGDLSHHVLHKELGEKNDSSNSWLLCSPNPNDDGFEVVMACMPKSSSATSSSIEAVSMDDDEPFEQIETLQHNPQMYVQDDTKWLLPMAGRRTALGDISMLTRDLGKMRTSLPWVGLSEMADWLLPPRGRKAACTESSTMTCGTTAENCSQWLLASGKHKKLAAKSFYATQVRDMFRPYFEHADVSVWVADGKNLA